MRSVQKSVTEVLRLKRYAFVALVGTAAAFAISVWLQNIPLIVNVFLSPLFTLLDKLSFLLRLLGGITTSITVLSATLIVIVSLVFGVNIALLLYSFRRGQQSKLSAGAGTFGGLLTAVFGAGCASCGTYLLGATLASLGASGLLSFLPLGGQEFLLGSIVLLTASVVWVSKSIQASKVCAVVPTTNNYY